MYDTKFVEAICRSFGQQPKNSRRADQLLDLLQAVVQEDEPEIREQLGAVIKMDLRSELRQEN